MRTTTVVIGAGHAGLAMSRHLSDLSIDHVVLERGEVANSWKTERWDSLRLLTPNWQSRLPGYEYDGNDPDGFRTMPETVSFLDRYAAATAAPVQTHTTVISVRMVDDEYEVITDRGTWRARTVVLANGATTVPKIPGVSDAFPASIRQLSPLQYRNPDQIDEGGVLVVGGSASGIQIAEELQLSGRQVTLALGEHVRVPRMYRGRDIKWWMDQTGVLDEMYTDVDSVDRVRNVPSLQLIGSSERRSIDVNALRNHGVQVVGRLVGMTGEKAQFSGSLKNLTAMADLKMNRLLTRIDQWADDAGLSSTLDDEYRPDATVVDEDPALMVNLDRSNIKTVLWATGFKPDYSWLDVPVFDRKGRLRHDGGVVDAPGLYVLGLPFLRRRKSSLIDGAGDDARDLSQHLAHYLARRHSGDRSMPSLQVA